jgi:hypothetical protein
MKNQVSKPLFSRNPKGKSGNGFPCPFSINATARGSLWAKSYPSDRGTSSDFPHGLGFRAENRVVVPLRFSTKSLSRDSLNPFGSDAVDYRVRRHSAEMGRGRARSTWYRKHRGHPSLFMCLRYILLV